MSDPVPASAPPSEPPRGEDRITVLLFAAAREAAGQGRIEMERTPGLTAAAVWDELVRRHPALAAHSASVSVAVNHRFRPRDTALESGDEVAFLPPVSGG